MSEGNRVFITGLGALTSCGNTVDKTWSSVLAGDSGIAEITQWDISSWPARLGGELKDFQPAKMLPDRKLIKVISRQDVMGINAAVQAVEHSGMISYRDELPSRVEFDENTAVFVGSPGNKYYQQYDFLPLLAQTKGDMKAFAQHLFDEVHPMWLLRILPNNVLAYTGMTYGFKGPNHNVTNHAVGGTQAIIEAYHAIKSGQAARAVVVAYDVGIEPNALFYYDKLGVISTRHLKPFDTEHDGTLLAEGASALVLESEESAVARNAVCYGELLGGLSATEGAGLFSIDNEGEALSSLMNRTLTELGVSPNDIGMVVAHGNGNIKSDNTEAMAIDNVFTSHHVPVTAFKWAMGHTLCASGVLDAVLTTYAVNRNCVPGIAVLEKKASTCSALNVSSSTRVMNKNTPYALMINRGFGSMNACLVVKSCE